MIIGMEVYSNEQWQGPDRKGNYIVKAYDLATLKAFALRWMARDEARGGSAEGIYHNFYVITDDLNRAELDSLGDELLELEMLLHPADFEQCEHGLSANNCYGPMHYSDQF